jgi:uncharacterized protein DUF3987
MPQRRSNPNWLQAFVEYGSYGEAPLSMYFWVGVCTIAGALRRRVWIDLKYFQWIPNFYVLLVAPPGIVAKSTTASVGMNLLRAVDGVKFGPDVVTWQALAKSFSEALEFVEMPDGLQHGMSSLMIESSELGTFLNPQDREMVDFLVTLWDGKKGAVRKLTKTQGEDVIENPCINLIACTTPAWIEGNFPEYMIGGGFTSRCIFVFAEEKRQFVAYPHLVVPAGFDTMRQKLIDDLRIISELKGQFVLLPETIKWGEKWYEEHYATRPAYLNNERFGGYIARKQTHIHKLAMILSAARTDTLEISADDLSSANKIVTSLESAMPKVFERIGMTPETRGAGLLVARVRQAGAEGISRRALYSEMFRELSYNDFQNSLEAGFEAGKIYWEGAGADAIVRAK